MAHLNLLVLRARDPEKLARFYSLLGLEFAEERHGAGPSHLSCQVGESVFEIYPLGSESQDTTATRLGFGVESLNETVAAISKLGRAHILNEPRSTQWGRTALVMDPEGHKIELRESA